MRSPETVAEALLDYYGVRVTTFLLRGHDAFDDLVGYSELISKVRGAPSPLRHPRPRAKTEGNVTGLDAFQPKALERDRERYRSVPFRWLEGRRQ